MYAASWVRDIGPDLRPNDYKKKEDTGEKKKEESGGETSALEDLGEQNILLTDCSWVRRYLREFFIRVAVAARGGMETLRPALQRLYMVRASAYRDALKSFVQGYQEGVQQVREKKQDAGPEPGGDAPGKSTGSSS